MQTQFESLEAEVLKLSVAERAKLAEHLIASLDEDSEIEADPFMKVKVAGCGPARRLLSLCGQRK